MPVNIDSVYLLLISKPERENMCVILFVCYRVITCFSLTLARAIHSLFSPIFMPITHAQLSVKRKKKEKKLVVVVVVYR
jgi:hypothetical protein